MAYRNFQHFIQTLEENKELICIKEFVNPHLEITEIVDRIVKNSDSGKALLFENTGTNFPVLINAFGSYKRMCLALGVDNLDDFTKEIELLFQQSRFLSEKKGIKLLSKLHRYLSFLPKIISGKAPCQEIIQIKPDITKLPVLKCWPYDGGQFITLPIVHTKSPVTGSRNVGMYRMQVFGPQLTAMHWHLHKGGAKHFDEYKQLNKKMPVAVALGGDPIYTYCATAPLPENFDEYIFAGFLRKKRVELVKCITQDIEVPADVDFVIEGYINPNEDLILEGPFGDHTGYYSLPDYYPKFHITCITHCKNAVYPATVVGIPPQEDAFFMKSTERIFFPLIQKTYLPEIIDWDFPVAGVGHNLVIVQIYKKYPGNVQKVINSILGAGQLMFSKIVIVVDKKAHPLTPSPSEGEQKVLPPTGGKDFPPVPPDADSAEGGTVNIHDYEKVAKTVLNNIDLKNDLYFFNGPMDPLDHSCPQPAFGGKMGIDATINQSSVADFVGTGISHQSPTLSGQASVNNINFDSIKQRFIEIADINASLLEKDLPILIVSVKKSQIEHIKKLNEKLVNLPELVDIKIILYLDHIVDIHDLFNVTWRFLSNFDPKRDILVSSNLPTPPLRGNRHSYQEGIYPLVGGEDRKALLRWTIGLDGTEKTKQYDNFQRPSPNIVTMDDKTIKAIDEKWEKLGLGEFIPSPSLKFNKQRFGDGVER